MCEFRQGSLVFGDLGPRFQGELARSGNALGLVADGSQVWQVLRVSSASKNILLGLGETRPVVLRRLDLCVQRLEFVFANRDLRLDLVRLGLDPLLFGLRLMQRRFIFGADGGDLGVGQRRIAHIALALLVCQGLDLACPVLRLPLGTGVLLAQGGELRPQSLQLGPFGDGLFLAPVGGGDARGERIPLGAEKIKSLTREADWS